MLKSVTVQESRRQGSVNSPIRTNRTNSRKQPKIITNIKGSQNDKLKLTSRLNAAVDDLIEMGQKYKKRAEHVAKHLEGSHITSSVFDTKSYRESMPRDESELRSFQLKSKVGIKANLNASHEPQSIHNPESSIVSIADSMVNPETMLIKSKEKANNKDIQSLLKDSEKIKVTVGEHTLKSKMDQASQERQDT